jgi:hypothetical protein
MLKVQRATVTGPSLASLPIRSALFGRPVETADYVSAR